MRRVSVIEAGPVTVIGKRTKEKDGYTALIVGLGEREPRHTSKPRAGIFKKANVTPKRTVRELRVEDDFAAKFEVGQTMKLDEISSQASSSTRRARRAAVASPVSCADGTSRGASTRTGRTSTSGTAGRSAPT